MSVIVAVDPGGQQTGMVAVQERRVLDWALVERDGMALSDYGSLVVWHLEDISRFRDVVAVEAVNEPTPHMGITSVRGILDTAWLVGYLHGALNADAVVEIDPNRHGSLPLAWYRERYPSLVGDRERSGAGKLRHVRSALDVALVAPAQLRIAEVD